MADETDEPEITENDVAAEQPAPAAPVAPSRAAGQDMGYSSRGAAAPQGTDVGARPAPILTPTDIADPNARIDRAAVAQKAREGRAQLLKDRWNSDYSASKNVPGNGYQILPEEQADLEAQGYRMTPRTIAAAAARHEGAAVQQAIRDEEERVRQENAANKRERDGEMSRVEQQMRNTGQRYFIDSNRTVQPIKDPATGRPLYNPTAWEQGTHPQTGQPVLTKRDNYGQMQFKTPSIVHNPDLTDNQLYYKFPNGNTVPAGDIEELKKSPDFGIKRAAIKASGQRRAAQWKEAIAPMTDIAAAADQNHKLATQQILDLQQSTQTVQDEVNQLAVNPQLKETEGGILGYGGKPTQAAQALQSKLAAREDVLKQQNDELSKLQESVKATGELGRAKRQAQLNLGIFKSKAQHDNYSNLADERRAILQSQGKSEAGDPTLAAILKAQESYGAEISRYGATAQTEGITPEAGPSARGPAAAAPAGPTGAHPLNSGPAPLTDDQRIASTGTRLDIGAPIPGRPGAFESLPPPPHGNDPVVDPDNPDAPPPPASKITLSQQNLPPTNAEIAKRFQDIQDQAQPALDMLGTAASGIDALRQKEIGEGLAAQAASKPGSGQENEPFALAQKGVTHIGGVSVDQLGKRYGTGKGDITPLTMVKMRQRMTELDATLNAAGQQDITKMYPTPTTNIDPKLRGSMKQEYDYLDSLFKQRMARIAPADQTRINDFISSQRSSAAGALARSAGTQALPTYAGVHGFETGAALGAQLSVGAPGAAKVIIPLVTGTIGAFGMSYLANKAQQKVLKTVAPEAFKELERLQGQDWEQQPFAVMAGNQAAAMASFKINPKATFDGLASISKLARGAEVTAAEKAAALHLAQQTGMGAALGLADPLAHGEKPTVAGVTSSVAQMLLYGNSRLGTKALVDHIDAKFPDVFWKRSGITPEEFTTKYVEAIRAQNSEAGATEEQSRMLQKVNDAASAAGISFKDLKAGRVLAEVMENQPRWTQKILPKGVTKINRRLGAQGEVLEETKTVEHNLRPEPRGSEVTFKKAPGGEAAAGEAGKAAPTPEPPSTGPQARLPAPAEHAAATEAADAAAEVVTQHGEASEAAGRAQEHQATIEKFQQHLDTLPPEQAEQHQADMDEKWHDSEEGVKAGELTDQADELRKQVKAAPKAEKKALAERADALERQAEGIREDFAHAQRQDILAKAEAAPAEELGPEAKKAGPTKLASVKAGLADKDTTFHYNVYPRESVPPGKSRVAQVDLSSPNAPESKSDKVRTYGSTNLRLLKELGHELPDVPESLPAGTYTLDEIKAAIAKEKAGPAKAATTPELGNQRVRLKVKRGNGSEAELEMSARDAHKRVSDHLSVLNKLRDCLEGKT